MRTLKQSVSKIIGNNILPNSKVLGRRQDEGGREFELKKNQNNVTFVEESLLRSMSYISRSTSTNRQLMNFEIYYPGSYSMITAITV